MTDAIPANAVEVRRTFAYARSRAEIEDAIGCVGQDLSRSSTSVGAAYAAVHAAGSASYHSYILGQTSDIADGLLMKAEGLLPRFHADDELRLRATMALDIARHRLSRNGWRAQELLALQQRLDNASQDLSKLNPKAQELFEYKLELAHYHRYIGAWDRALNLYRELSAIVWHPVGIEYQLVVLRHYLVSLACDWIEMLAVPSLLAPPSQVLLHTCLRRALRLLEETAAIDQFGTFRVHYLKHRALFLALEGNDPAARAALADAERAVDDIDARKTRLLCRQFRGLLEGVSGRTSAALDAFSSSDELAHGYYPREEFETAFARGLFLARDGDHAGAYDWFARGARANGLGNQTYKATSASFLRQVRSASTPVECLVYPTEVMSDFSCFLAKWQGVDPREIDEPLARAERVPNLTSTTPNGDPAGTNRVPLAGRKEEVEREEIESVVPDHTRTPVRPPRLTALLGLGMVTWMAGTFAAILALVNAGILSIRRDGSIVLSLGTFFGILAGTLAASAFLHAARTRPPIAPRRVRALLLMSTGLGVLTALLATVSLLSAGLVPATPGAVELPTLGSLLATLAGLLAVYAAWDGFKRGPHGIRNAN